MIILELAYKLMTHDVAYVPGASQETQLPCVGFILLPFTCSTLQGGVLAPSLRLGGP